MTLTIKTTFSTTAHAEPFSWDGNKTSKMSRLYKNLNILGFSWIGKFLISQKTIANFTNLSHRIWTNTYVISFM